MFSPPAGLSETPLLAWLFVTVVFTNVSLSLFVVPWTALYAEFSDDYDERTTIVTWRYAVGWLGSIVFIFAAWTFIFPSTPAYTPGQLNPHGQHEPEGLRPAQAERTVPDAGRSVLAF